jgi:hypothetical protein
LERLQAASELLRNVERFFYLSRCLEGQLSNIDNEKEKGIEYTKAALNLGELGVKLWNTLCLLIFITVLILIFIYVIYQRDSFTRCKF